MTIDPSADAPHAQPASATPASTPTPPETSAPDKPPAEGDEPFPLPRIKIGSQRPAVAKVAARPQPQPQSAPAPAEQGKKKFPPPNKRHQLSPELEAELQEAMGDVALDEIVKQGDKAAPTADVEPESRHKARVVSIHREDVFVDFGQRNQGVVPLKQFEQPPEPGAGDRGDRQLLRCR